MKKGLPLRAVIFLAQKCCSKNESGIRSVSIPSRYPDALPGTVEDGMPTEKDALDSLHAARALASLILPR